MLVAVVVLPSAGVALVTRMIFGGLPVVESRSEVRRAAEGFREVRLRLREHADIALCDGELLGILRADLARARNDGERRQLGDAFDLRNAAQPGIQRLHQEGDDDAAQKRKEHAEHKDVAARRDGGRRRDHGDIHDVDLA